MALDFIFFLFFHVTVADCMTLKLYDNGDANNDVRMKLFRQFESEIGNMDRHKHSVIIS